MPLARNWHQPHCVRPGSLMLFVQWDSMYMTKVIYPFKFGVRIA
jgi:hypothetical protein